MKEFLQGQGVVPPAPLASSNRMTGPSPCSPHLVAHTVGNKMIDRVWTQDHTWWTEIR